MNFLHNAASFDNWFARVAAPTQPALSPLFLPEQESPFFGLQISPDRGFDMPLHEMSLLSTPGFHGLLHEDGGFFSF